MDVRKPAGLRVATFLVIADAAFWLIFGLYFLAESHPNLPHAPTFEERPPDLIFFGRAMSYLDHEKLRPFVKVAWTLQGVSFRAGEPFNRWFSRRDILVDHTYAGISVGGYYVLLVCLVSFVQWFLIGLLIDWFRQWRTGRRNQRLDERHSTS